MKASLLAGFLCLSTVGFSEVDHEMIQHHEVLRVLVSEYLEQADIPKAGNLIPQSEGGYRCQVFSPETGEMEEWLMTFLTLPTGGGRFVRLRLEQPEKDTKENFLLIKSAVSYRGEGNSPSKEVRINPWVFESSDYYIWRKQPGESNYLAPKPNYTGHPNAYEHHLEKTSWRYHLPLQQVLGRTFNTLSVSKNKLNSEELFLELGSKTDVLYLDAFGKPIMEMDKQLAAEYTADLSYERTEYGRTDNGYKTYDATTGLFTPRNATPKLIPQINGNASLPRSHSFKDSSTAFADYRMTGIGVCSPNQE